MLLPIGTYWFVDAEGRVGIGTIEPKEKLEVVGNVQVRGSGNGVIFPDGTKQASAADNLGLGVPSGYSILGTTQTPPQGYSLVGSLDSADTWKTTTTIPTPRIGFAAATCNNRIYVFGGQWQGFNLDTVEEYDPSSGFWTTKSPLSMPRVNAEAATVNGKIYLFGGANIAGYGFIVLVEEYDPLSDTWSPQPPLPTGRYSPAVVVHEGKVFVIGGHNGQAPVVNVEAYDPENKTWAVYNSMLLSVEAAGAVSVGNQIFVFGGSVQKFNPATNTWTVETAMPNPRTALGVCALNGRVLTFGGSSDLEHSGPSLPWVDEFNPIYGTWAKKTPLETAVQHAIALPIVDKIYLVGSTDPLSWPSNGTYPIQEYTPTSRFFIFQKN